MSASAIAHANNFVTWHNNNSSNSTSTINNNNNINNNTTVTSGMVNVYSPLTKGHMDREEQKVTQSTSSQLQQSLPRSSIIVQPMQMNSHSPIFASTSALSPTYVSSSSSNNNTINNNNNYNNNDITAH